MARWLLLCTAMGGLMALAACTPLGEAGTLAPADLPAGTATVHGSATVAATATIEPAPTPTSQVRLPVIDPLDIEGDMQVAGSTTVFPLVAAMYQRFIQEGYAGVMRINSVGSSRGFALLCEEGWADVAMSSRPMTHAEMEMCARNGRIPIEFPIGVDAVTVAVQAETDFVTDVTTPTLRAIFTSTHWSDVDATWPETPIQRFLPEQKSGTFDFFVARIFRGQAADLFQAGQITFEREPQILAQSLALTPNGVGVFGHAYYMPNRASLRPLSIAGVAPQAEEVAQGDYLLTRSLYLYADPVTLAQNEQVNAFLNFVLTHVNEEIERIGYFPAEPANLDRSRTNLLQAADSIVAAGSSIIFPLMQIMSQRFNENGYVNEMVLEDIGSGAGFERFCQGDNIDIVMSSRRITAEEAAACAAVEREPLELSVGIDALAIVVNPANTFVEELSIEQLAHVFTATRWSDVNADWPAERIERYIPNQDSGSFDFFVQRVFNDESEPLLNALRTAQIDENDMLAEEVAANVNAIGFLAYADYQSRIDVLKVLEIDGVEPSARTVESGEYLLSRPLFLYSAPTILQSRPQVAAFLHFYLNQITDAITQVGFFPASEATLNRGRASMIAGMDIEPE